MKKSSTALHTSGVSFELFLVRFFLARRFVEATQLDPLIHLEIVLGLTSTALAVFRTPPCIWYLRNASWNKWWSYVMRIYSEHTAHFLLGEKVTAGCAKLISDQSSEWQQ